MAITRPVTRTTISTTGWGIPITDEVNRLSAALPASISVIPTAWTTPTYQNGWVEYAAGRGAQYRKIGDIVYIRGIIKNGTAGLTAFTLPSGFRPNPDVSFIVNRDALTGIVTIDVTGEVKPATTAGYIYLNPIFFAIN